MDQYSLSTVKVETKNVDEFIHFYLAVSAIENGDECRKHFYPTYGLSHLFTKLTENLLQRKMVKLAKNLLQRKTVKSAENLLQRKSVKLAGNLLQLNCLSPIVFVLVWLLGL